MRSVLMSACIAMLFLFSSLASAYEVLNVCARYSNTGKAYKVEVNLIDGSELNQRTSSFNYEAFSKYAVIFWGEEKVTMIKLDFSVGGISTFGTFGVDQQGRRWELSKNTQFCS